jgi:signal transduction histidine kinase
MLSGNDGTAVCQLISFIDISERINAQNEQQRLLADLQERVKELKCLYSIVSVQHSGESTLEGILRHIVASIPDSLRWPSCAYSRIVTGNIDICTQNFKLHCPLFTVPLNAGNETGFLEVGYYESGCHEENGKHLLEEEKDLLFAAAKEIERLIEYKLNEEELARNRAHLLQADKISSIGILSAEIIHEIGNPNNFIALNAKMLHQAWSNIKPILDTYYENNGDFSVAGLPFSEARQEISRLLDGIAEGSERIRKISSLLQTFISKKRPNQHETFRINDAVKKAVEFSKSYIDSCTEHFEMSLTPENPLVRGEEGQIQQVVINFVTNACQALTSRKDHIRIATLLDYDSRSVLIRVKDEGVGIDSREIPRVMDPFFSTKRDRNCSGLGLSISNDIALSHGGSIKLDSTPGSGTTAILVLPCTGSGDTFYK